MSEPVVIGNATLYCGDCIDLLRTMPDNSIEACLTDPPYGLSNHTEADIRACMSAWLAGKPYQHGKAGFMGKDWDSFVPGPEMWKELYRVLKPGAHLLVFAGTRTADLMSLALRLAGFEAREMCLWVFGAGFPKALDVSAAIDKMKGMEREVVGYKPLQYPDSDCWGTARKNGGTTKGVNTPFGGTEYIEGGLTKITAPASPEAAQWDGWKSALKPCYEPILLFRKPLDGTIAETVLKWGTGGLNVGACRVGYVSEEDIAQAEAKSRVTANRNQQVCKQHIFAKSEVQNNFDRSIGRYPGNLIVSSDEEVERCFPVTGPAKIGIRNQKARPYQLSKGAERERIGDMFGHNDAGGSASRFFQHCDFTIDEIAEMNGIELKRMVYSGKASKRDRDEGCEGMEERDAMDFIGSGIDGRGNAYETQPRHNHHPTCKPTSILRHLLRMITPPGATVIDPFFGSGSTGKAALLEGFNVIGIEREPEYFEIAQARCAYVSPEAFTVQPTPRKAATASQQSTLFEEAA